MDNIKLNFINRSNDINNSEIVIFQKNVAQNFDETVVAWKVIKNCGRNDNHPFTYTMEIQVSASDSYGNYSPKLTAYNGNAFEMIKDTSGDVLRLSSTSATNANEVEIINKLTVGAINANCYRDGSLVAIKTNLAPEEKAFFEFQPTIFIGVASQVDEGEVLNSAIVSEINTKFNLLGISSADIVMTGGGAGRNATPFSFTLENINK